MNKFPGAKSLYITILGYTSYSNQVLFPLRTYCPCNFENKIYEKIIFMSPRKPYSISSLHWKLPQKFSLLNKHWYVVSIKLIRKWRVWGFFLSLWYKHLQILKPKGKRKKYLFCLFLIFLGPYRFSAPVTIIISDILDSYFLFGITFFFPNEAFWEKKKTYGVQSSGSGDLRQESANFIKE